jgi:hypothetical protein
VLAGVGAVLLLFFAIGLFVVSRPHPTVSVSPTTVSGGGSVTVTATGFTPGATIDVYYVASAAIKVRSQRADTNGALVTGFSIPSQLIPGTHEVRACAGQTCATAALTVVR